MIGGGSLLMKLAVVILSLLLSATTLSQDNSRPLLPNQPVLSQMTGNCYTHSGTDVLTGIFLRENRLDSVDQPHPLVLGGIVSADVGRGNISSGLSCDFFNAAKQIRTPVCSVNGFNKFVANSGMSVNSVKENINKLDRSMQTLHNLFAKVGWSTSDRRLALQKANEVIAATCELNALADLNDESILRLVDQSREIISKLRPIDTSSVRSFLRDILTIGPTTIISRNIGGSILYGASGRSAMNRILEDTYKKINDECIDFSRTRNISMVGSNFFTASNRFTCHDDIYKRPQLKGARLKEQLDFIDRQVRAGYPTGVFMCSAIFYGQSPVKSGYRSSNGECVNGGGHAVTVTGIEYRNGKRFFKIRNSWGAGSCSGVRRGRQICNEQFRINNEGGCPTERSLTCENGVYYMSEDYFGLGLWGHTRLTVPRRRQ